MKPRSDEPMQPNDFRERNRLEGIPDECLEAADCTKAAPDFTAMAEEAYIAGLCVVSAEASLCTGCDVRPPWEHRCHGKPCPCPDCQPAEAAAEIAALDMQVLARALGYERFYVQYQAAQELMQAVHSKAAAALQAAEREREKTIKPGLIWRVADAIGPTIWETATVQHYELVKHAALAAIRQIASELPPITGQLLLKAAGLWEPKKGTER